MPPDDVRPIREIAREVFGDTTPVLVERVRDGISTIVYRLRRGQEIFYLRVLPEVGESFAPEAYIHTLLHRRGVHVPEVLYLEHCNESFQRSVMVTTQIRGQPLGQLSRAADPTDILLAAGRELAIVNSVPVDGFGWIKREAREVSRLEAEQSSNRAFLLEDLDQHVFALRESVLTAREVATVHDLVAGHAEWLDVAQGQLAHGDFDLTHIYQEDGHYTGIIDFGEIRGTGPYYDLGHFCLRDGETLPYSALGALVTGYQQVAPLPADHDLQIAFLSLLIGIRFLGRGLQRLTAHELSARTQSHARASILQDLALLRREV